MPAWGLVQTLNAVFACGKILFFFHTGNKNYSSICSQEYSLSFCDNFGHRWEAGRSSGQPSHLREIEL
jgi:hypothetical protein